MRFENYRMKSKFAVSQFLIVACLCCIGCMGESSTIAVRTAQVAFDEAVPLLNDNDYSQALPKLESAIQSGSLSADQFAMALLMRYRSGCVDSQEVNIPKDFKLCRICVPFGKVSLKRTFGSSDTNIHGVTWHRMCQALND